MARSTLVHIVFWTRMHPTQTSNGTGFYEFTGLSAGIAYTIVLDECTLTAGVRTSTTGNNPYVRTLAPAEVVADADFGYTNLLPFFEGFESSSANETYTADSSCVAGAPAFSFETALQSAGVSIVSENRPFRSG